MHAHEHNGGVRAISEWVMVRVLAQHPTLLDMISNAFQQEAPPPPSLVISVVVVARALAVRMRSHEHKGN